MDKTKLQALKFQLLRGHQQVAEKQIASALSALQAARDVGIDSASAQRNLDGCRAYLARVEAKLRGEYTQ